MDYKNKYLKYKNKYLELKQTAGATDQQIPKSWRQLLRERERERERERRERERERLELLERERLERERLELLERERLERERLEQESKEEPNNWETQTHHKKQKARQERQAQAQLQAQLQAQRQSQAQPQAQAQPQRQAPRQAPRQAQGQRQLEKIEKDYEINTQVDYYITRMNVDSDFKDLLQQIRKRNYPPNDTMKKQGLRNYIKYLSDHKIITHIINNTLLISFNVEHYIKVCDRIGKINDTNDYYIDIINYKNNHILGLLQRIMDEALPDITNIVINIQEGYPTLYKKLVNELLFRREFNGKPTKLICQNLYEGWQDESMSSHTNYERTISRHTRLWANGCFFSIEFHLDHFPKIEYLNDNIQDIPIEDADNNQHGHGPRKNIFQTEYLLSIHIARKQNIPENLQLLINANPVLLYSKRFRKTNNGIKKNNLILTCRGIHFNNTNVGDIINLHLNMWGENSYNHDISNITNLIILIKNNHLGSIETDLNFTDGSDDIAYNDVQMSLVEEYNHEIILHRNSVCLGDFNILGENMYNYQGIESGNLLLDLKKFDDNLFTFRELKPVEYPYHGFDHFISITQET